MSFKKTYYWRNQKGQLQTSQGIELTQNEKMMLCKKNLRLVKQQTNRG